MGSIYKYACRDDTYGLPYNPAAGTGKRREPDPAEIITYTPADVEAIVRAAAAGAHRDAVRIVMGPDELEVRRLEDEQDACVILVAAFRGLRMGECLGLRWRHVMWDAQRLHVQLNYVQGREDTPKGRRARTVPLADQPAQALARLSQRPMFTRSADLVFPSRAGRASERVGAERHERSWNGSCSVWPQLGRLRADCSGADGEACCSCHRPGARMPVTCPA